MSKLAHSVYGAPGFSKEKEALFQQIQAEIKEAKRIQEQLHCSWTEALLLAKEKKEDG